MVKPLAITGLLVASCALINLFLCFHVFDGREPTLLEAHLERSSRVGIAPNRTSILPRVNPSDNTDQQGPKGRFPLYGTPEFSQQCGWTIRNASKSQNCTFLAQPQYRDNEGISSFVTKIAAAQILAHQAGCSVMFHYGPDVDIASVLMPFPSQDPSHPTIDWRAPPDQVANGCKNVPQCFVAQRFYKSGLSKQEKALGPHMAAPPYYRFAYGGTKNHHLNGSFLPPLQQALPGFEIETGMACALGSLFQLAPTSAEFEPELFTRILPTLRSKDALVITLYVRTGHTDAVATAEETNKSTPEETESYHRVVAVGISRCALELEKKHLAKGAYSRVVWMVVTDSQYVKKWIRGSYDTRFSGGNHTVEREVVTTRSRGVHTRARRGPSTADFAEAMIDWYLIGESDMVVFDSRSVSFGSTASLRTARPVYKPPQCSRQVLVREKVE